MLLYTYFAFLIVISVREAHNQMVLIGDALEAFRPCDSGILSMERIIGGRPRTENYWDGHIDLNDWSQLSEVRIGLTVDNPATIELNEDDGRVLVNNRTFHHISAFDHPPQLTGLKFKVRGTPFGAFPNIDRITLNGMDVCENPRKWSPTILGTRGGAGQTEEKKPSASKCGKRLVQHQALITNGYPSKEGDWPWHAAIYHFERLEQKYKCGGTLISAKAVVTAAHCVYEQGRPIVVERVVVHLGKFNRLVASPNTQEFAVFKITTHNGFTYNDLQNDIALIRLATEAIFTSYIQPICLWDANKIPLSNVIDRNGIVVGWGLNEQDKQAVVLSQARMPVVSITTCLASNRDFFGLFLSDNTFCAGFRNGTSVCNGDSGGGMYFLEDNSYHLRGIVSLTVSRSDTNVCNPEEYVIFTDAAKYLPWINEQLNA